MLDYGLIVEILLCFLLKSFGKNQVQFQFLALGESREKKKREKKKAAMAA